MFVSADAAAAATLGRGAGLCLLVVEIKGGFWRDGNGGGRAKAGNQSGRAGPVASVVVVVVVVVGTKTQRILYQSKKPLPMDRARWWDIDVCVCECAKDGVRWDGWVRLRSRTKVRLTRG